MANYNDPGYVRDYEECWAPYLRLLTARLADAAGPNVGADSVIIDLGAGTGGLTTQLLDLGPKLIYAVEPSTEMSARIVKDQAVRVIGYDAGDKAVGPAASADVVTIAFLFQELTERQVADVLANANRLLKAGGWLFVLAWAEDRDDAISPLFRS